jgi:purine-binding chemotaxis protein CheW
MTMIAAHPFPSQSEIASPQRVSRQRSILLFHLGDQAYGIPLHAVQEVVLMPELARPHNSPAMLAGFLNLAGKAISVLRLSSLFGLPEQPIKLYTPIIVLRHPDYHLALVVEKMSRIVSLSENAFMPVPGKHSLNGCIEGVATIAGQSIFLLSPQRILFEKEQQYLAELQDREQARLRELEESIP